MIGRNIAKIGVELEGWFRHRTEYPIHRDGSIDMAGLKEHNQTPGIVGEKSSPAFDNLEDLARWLYKEYPHRRNRTCGFHVNVSLTDVALLRRCVASDIHNAMIQVILRYAKAQRFGKPFQERITPKARFSQLTFNSGIKYSAINWSKVLWNDTPYVEYRIFSMVMPPTKAMNCVKFLAKLTDLVAESVKIHGDKHEEWINQLVKLS